MRANDRSMLSVTAALYSEVSSCMADTRPMLTPAMLTGAPTFSPPMLSNFASTL